VRVFSVSRYSNDANLTLMPKFSIKDLLLGATIAAIGFAMVGIGFRFAVPNDPRHAGTQAYLLGAGGLLIGSGLAYPLGKGGTPFLLICGVIAMLIVIYIFTLMGSLP
jgi:hypothetical protein